MWLIWIILGFIVGYFVCQSDRPVLTAKESVDYLQATKESDKWILRSKQEIEDDRIERIIEKHASDRYLQYLDNCMKYGEGDLVTTGAIYVPSYCHVSDYIYNLYDSETAKYHNVNINDLIDQRFKELKDKNK